MLPPFAAYEFPYPKSCHVYLNGTQSIPPNVNTVVVVNAVAWDTYGFYVGGSTNYINIPEDGLYFVASGVHSMAVITAPIGIAVWRNGVNDFGIVYSANTTNTMQVFVSYMNMFNMGDKLEFVTYSRASTNIDIGNTTFHCFLQILKLPYVTKGF